MALPIQAKSETTTCNRVYRISTGLHRTDSDLAIPMFRTGNGQKSFAYRGASLWNSLDLETKMAPSINAFKSKLKGK